jgi:hypothetical protein
MGMSLEPLLPMGMICSLFMLPGTWGIQERTHVSFILGVSTLVFCFQAILRIANLAKDQNLSKRLKQDIHQFIVKGYPLVRYLHFTCTYTHT